LRAAGAAGFWFVQGAILAAAGGADPVRAPSPLSSLAISGQATLGIRPPVVLRRSKYQSRLRSVFPKG
jgi:hypothetical protein